MEPEKIITYYETEVFQSFPYPIALARSVHAENKKISFFPIHNNPSFEFYGKSFTHYTNLRALISILKNKNVRLYDLTNANDPYELKLVGEHISDDLTINRLKRNTFTLSMCSVDEAEEMLDLWRFYGHNGEGVAIVFTFPNEAPGPIDQNFDVDPIIYDVEEKIKPLLEKHKEAQHKYSEWEITIDFSHLLKFCKSTHFASEKEVRLMYPARHREQINSITNRRYPGAQKYAENHDINSRDEIVKYIEVPISGNDAFLKIEKIIVGFKKDDATANALRDFSEKCLDYTIDVIPSKFTGKFR